MVLVIGVTSNVERRVVSRPPGTGVAFRNLGTVPSYPDTPDACPVVEPMFPVWPFLTTGARDAALGANSKRAHRVAHSPPGEVDDDLERETDPTTSRAAPGPGA